MALFVLLPTTGFAEPGQGHLEAGTNPGLQSLWTLLSQSAHSEEEGSAVFDQKCSRCILQLGFRAVLCLSFL